MVKASKGQRCRTRGVMRKNARQKGQGPITRQFTKFEEGESAMIIIDSAERKGQPHARYQGHTGVVKEAQGRAYLVRIRDGGKYKMVLAFPQHLRKVK